MVIMYSIYIHWLCLCLGIQRIVALIPKYIPMHPAADHWFIMSQVVQSMAYMSYQNITISHFGLSVTRCGGQKRSCSCGNSRCILRSKTTHSHPMNTRKKVTPPFQPIRSINGYGEILWCGEGIGRNINCGIPCMINGVSRKQQTTHNFACPHNSRLACTSTSHIATCKLEMLFSCPSITLVP